MTRISGAVLGVALGAVTGLAAGCGHEPPTPEPSVSSPANSRTPAASPPSTATPTSTELRFALDDTATFPDGLEVSTGTSEVRQVVAGETGAESSGGQVVVFSIVLSNGTAAAYDPRSAVITASSGDANTPAPMISDSTAQLQSGFNEVVPQGEEATAAIGFAIPNAGLARITVTVTLNDGENNPVSFTGTAQKR